MRAETKKKLYNLLATTDSYLRNIPIKKIPDFLDDSESLVIEKKTKTSLESIAQKISQCNHCKLSKTRNFTVPGNGVANPFVMIIGEAPGQDEDLSSQPFVGRSGQLLDKMLAAIQLSKKTNVFISNVVKCRPPHNRNPESLEIEACRSWLDAQIILLKPKVILTLGKVAAHDLLDITDTMGNMHGNFYNYQGIPVMPTYHPSALLRNEAMKRPTWEDLKKFRTYLQKIAKGYTEKEYYDNPENKPVPAYPLNSLFNQFQRNTPQYTNFSNSSSKEGQ